jgi:Ca2+-binding EF-hand superfamily protein
MTNKYETSVQEHLHRKDDKITEAEYVYEEKLGKGKTREHRIHIKRSDFDRVGAANKKSILSFEDFLTVVRPFLMAEEAEKDIPEAFGILDTDNSNTIDINELAVFMPVIVPESNSFMLLRHFQTADKNSDYKLSFEEFTDFIKKGVIRDLALKRL